MIKDIPGSRVPITEQGAVISREWFRFLHGVYERMLGGNYRPWDDLRIEPTARNTGTGEPAFEKWFDDAAGTSAGVFLYSFTDEAVAVNEKQVFFTMQFPHSWDSTEIHMHIHWTPAANATAQAVRWGLEYTWKSPGEVYGDTTVIYASTTNPADANLVAGKHYRTAFAALDPGATASGLSSVLIGRLFRNSSNVADTYTNKCGLLYIDAHYRIDSLGSFSEASK